MADGSSALTYKWQQLAGPTTLLWSDRSAVQPIIQGLVFGTYRFQLQVTDAAGQVTTAVQDIGAVATDNNGIVIQANPAADIIFGPMIAFGRNPWPWQDQMTLQAATVRAPELAAFSPPSWIANLTGTITYTPAWANQAAQTTLASKLQSSDTSITVTDATKLDLTSLPTMIEVLHPGGWSYYEEIRVCSAFGNTLHACYDGRAWHAGQYQEVSSPQAWEAGATVVQIKTAGTGTTFLSDFCPAGPGEEGQISSSDGTVGVTAGSTALTGSGTNWQNNLQGQRIRIQGTHGGTGFVFFASVANVNSPTSITLGRIWPADADTSSSLAYAVIQPSRSIVRHWIRPDGSAGQQLENISSCESDTQIYHSNLFSAIKGVQTNQTYSSWNSFWFSDYGPNYYDEVLGEYAGYFRSGYNLFLSNARSIGDYWPKSPEFDEGWAGVSPRRVSATGMAAGAVLDGRTSNWTALRRLANNAVADPRVTKAPDPVTNPNPCDADLRETAYELSWISLAAMFDPVDTGSSTDPNQRSFWKAQLANAYQRDAACKGSQSEFPTSYWSGSGSYTMTNGSPTVKGTNIAPSLCNVAATGTVTIANGSTSATGSGFVANAKIVIMAQRFGQPYLFYSVFTVNSPAGITLATAYDGDSGTYPYQIEADTNWLSFATWADNPGNLDKFHHDVNTLYACQWVDSSTIRLDRPWSDPSGVYSAYRYLELGYGTQPFFNGIKTFAMKLASQAASGTTAANYAALANDTANWLLTTGFDPNTGGLHYARGFAGCEPNANPKMNCTYGTDSWSRQAARFLNGEAQNAMRVAFEARRTTQARSFGDKFYGAQWGKLGGPYSDDVYLSAIETDGAWNYKWLGFLFGIGMSHQWPAVRLGGVQAPFMLPKQVTFDLKSVSGATSVRVTVTAPSGAQTAYICTGSSCTVNVDARQGQHWRVIEYLDMRGTVLSQAAPALISACLPSVKC